MNIREDISYCTNAVPSPVQYRLLPLIFILAMKADIQLFAWKLHTIHHIVAWTHTKLDLLDFLPRTSIFLDYQNANSVLPPCYLESKVVEPSATTIVIMSPSPGTIEGDVEVSSTRSGSSHSNSDEVRLNAPMDIIRFPSQLRLNNVELPHSEVRLVLESMKM